MYPGLPRQRMKGMQRSIVVPSSTWKPEYQRSLGICLGYPPGVQHSTEDKWLSSHRKAEWESIALRMTHLTCFFSQDTVIYENILLIAEYTHLFLSFALL